MDVARLRHTAGKRVLAEAGLEETTGKRSNRIGSLPRSEEALPNESMRAEHMSRIAHLEHQLSPCREAASLQAAPECSLSPQCERSASLQAVEVDKQSGSMEEEGFSSRASYTLSPQCKDATSSVQFHSDKHTSHVQQDGFTTRVLSLQNQPLVGDEEAPDIYLPQDKQDFHMQEDVLTTEYMNLHAHPLPACKEGLEPVAQIIHTQEDGFVPTHLSEHMFPDLTTHLPEDPFNEEEQALLMMPTSQIPIFQEPLHMDTLPVLPLSSPPFSAGTASSLSISHSHSPLPSGHSITTSVQPSSSSQQPSLSSQTRPQITLSFYSRSNKSKSKTQPIILSTTSAQSGLSSENLTASKPFSHDPLHDFLNLSDETSQCSETLAASWSGSELERWTEPGSLADCWANFLGMDSEEHLRPHTANWETEKKEVDAQKQLFDDYCIEFSKQYSPREREVRFSYFVASCKEIAEINEQQRHPVAGLSVFSDRSESERDFMRGSDDLLPDEFYSVACANNISSDLSATTHEPESPTSSSIIDWVKAGVVSPQVRSQYQDQCWANASIECVESKVRLDSSCQSKERLSGQQVVDCLFDCPKTSLFDRPKTSTAVFSYGMEKGFLREDYPTTGLPKTCESEGLRLLHKPRVFLTSLLPADMRSNEAKLKERLKDCPQYVTIGNDPALAHYRGGIITSCKCKTDTKNHAVLLCGCGKQDRIKYWRFKNSWGEAWGERGFFRLVRNKGMCRIGQFFNRAGKTKVSDPSFMKEPKSREDVKEAKGGAGSCRVQSVGCCSFCSWCWH